MEMTIDTDVLEETNLSVSDYCTLYFLWKGAPELATKHVGVGIRNVNELQEKGWLKMGVKEGTDKFYFPNCTPRAKFLSLVTSDEDLMWYELCSKYPHKVTNGMGGYRPLRAADPDAFSNKKSKEKYLRVVKGNSVLHKKIMAQLETQLSEVRNNLQYMQGLEVWINQRTWEKYAPSEIGSDNEEKEEGYGNKLI